VSSDKPDDLTILWTTPDLVTSAEMVLLYALNAKKREWWNTVTVVVWGGSAELISRDEKIRSSVKDCIAAGVMFSACKKCTDDLGITDSLKEIGIEVRYWGEPLTRLLKSGARLITV